jgi:BASS family bile acid:Na+ symporter
MAEFFDRYLYAFMLISIASGLALPAQGAALEPLLGITLFILMYFSLLKIDFSALSFKPARMHLACLVVQFAALPVVAVLLAGATFAPALLAGIVLIAAAPAATASVIRVNLLKGDSGFTLLNMALSNLVAPFVVPAVSLLLLQATAPISAQELFLSMAKYVMIPFVLAYLTVRWRIAPLLRIRHADSAAFVLNSFIIAALAAPYLFSGADMLTLVSLIAALHALAFLAGYAIGGDEKTRLSTATLCSSKNTILTLVVAAEVLGAQAAVPAFLYSLVQLVSFSAQHYFWRGNAH